MIIKLEKKQIKIISIVIVALILAGVIFVLDDEGFFEDDTSYATFPVMSTINFGIMDDSYEEFEELQKTMSSKDARQQLLTTLNSETGGVESAELGVDGYTIFVTFSDGILAAIDTFDLDEPIDMPLLDETKTSEPVGGASFISSIKEENPPVGNLVVVGPVEKTTCKTKKMLVLGPCYFEFPKKPTDDTIQYFKDHGWSDEDITIKLVTEEPDLEGSDCFDISPSDYFNLEDYGIILFTGHGTIKARNNFNEDNLYLQFCYVTNESFIANKLLKQWMDNEQLIVFKKYLVGAEGSSYFIYSTAIRADLLRKMMNGHKLPSSYCSFATCYGTYFKDIYLDSGAKVFLSWDNSVDGEYADENMLNMARQMLEDTKCVYDAYTDQSVIKSYTTSDPDHPERGIVPAYTRHPKIYTKVVFYMHPDPTVDDTASNYYMPAWMDLTINEIPDSASFIRTSIYDGANLLVEVEQDITLGTETFTIDYVGEDVFTPTGEVSVKVDAFGSSGNSLATGEETISLVAGENLVIVSLSNEDTEYYWVLCGDAEGTKNITVYNSAFGAGHSHVGLILYINDDYTFYAWNNFNKYPFKANPGDELRIQYNLGYRAEGISWYFESIWLHHRDSDYKMKLSNGASGNYFGSDPYQSETVPVYNQTITVPEI